MEDWTGTSKGIFKILGASNHTESEREERDYYATNPKAAQYLCELLPLRNVWECASGEGHLAKVFEGLGILGRKSDIIDRTGDTEVFDFLSIRKESDLFGQGDNEGSWDGDIVTNPPYRYAKEFIENALFAVSEGRCVAMFLPIRYLEGKERRRLFEAYPPYKVFVSSSRIPCAKNGDFDNLSGSAVSYCWIVWKKGYNGETILEWFN